MSTVPLAVTRAAEPVAWQLRVGDSDRITLTRREVAVLCGLTYEQVRTLIRRRALRTVRRDRHILVADLVAFLGVRPSDALLAEVAGAQRLAVTVPEAAGLLRTSPSEVRRELLARRLPAGSTGHAHVIPISTLLALATADTSTGPDAA